MVGYKKLGLVLGAVAALALLPARADAQFVRYSPVFWSFEGNAGFVLPLGDLKDNSDSGITAGLAASYFLNPRFALRAEGSIDFLGESETLTGEDPDLRVWHFTGGFEYHLTDPTSNTFFTFDLGVGGVTFDTKIFTADGVNCDANTGICSAQTGASTTGSFDKTYLAVNGGLQLGYNFARHGSTGTPIATIFVGADAHVMFADEVDTQLLALYNGNTAGFGTVLAVPLTAGLRFNIP